MSLSSGSARKSSTPTSSDASVTPSQSTRSSISPDVSSSLVPHNRESHHESRSGSLSQHTENTSPPVFNASPPHSEPQPEPFLLRKWSNNWILSRQQSENAQEGVRGDLGLRLLHSSPEPLIDLIFVHGLRGGSVKTWRKGNDPRYFWPQCWLPMEKGFEKASIHSFGYDSDWGTTKQSALNVHDFGRALFEEMRTSHHLRDHVGCPIILVGHSMGGLVIKKAFILAHRDASSSWLARRIRTIFFLATPHRGSDFAGILKNILKISMLSKDYLRNLTAASEATQIINEEFPQYIEDVTLFSFFETLPMSFGGGLIVEKTSAVLGYRGERSTLMNANHRDICKFDSHNDPNYIKLRDSLSVAVGDLLRDVIHLKQKETQEQLRALQTFLGIQGQPEDHYDRAEGSCNWIDEREDFNDWRDSAGNVCGEPGDPSATVAFSPAFYWVSANPGTGKTVLAAHVVSRLHQCRLQCAYFYFHFGKKTAQTLGAFLRSIAYQMAKSNTAIREAVLRAFHDGSTFDHEDARTVWAKIFRGAIFRAQVLMPQYWVIDALDECLKYGELFTMLKGESLSFPLRVFVTSRKVPEIGRLFKPLGARLVAVEIPIANTMKDIEAYITSRQDELPIEAHEDKLKLSKQILAKSKASFLWAKLVLDELQGVCAYESILDVLNGIPEDMVPYYKRTVGRMAENVREKHISRAILLWVVSSARPLSTSELAQALELDIKKSFPNISTAVDGLCGQLVVIDKQTDLVHIIHATAREFLLSESAGEFRITRTEAQERVALICLQLLSGRAFSPPRNRRLLVVTDDGRKRKAEAAGPLTGYVVAHFSEHVFGSSSESDSVLIALDRFLKTNVLTWIDLVAQASDLPSLIRAEKNVGAYLDRRAKHTSPFDLQPEVKSARSWAACLGRLATGFGKALQSCPASIYFLIPPLCPTKTAIYQSFGKSADGLALCGFRNSEWDDCIANIAFEDQAASAVICGDSSIAIGMESGSIRLFHSQSFQHEMSIPHSHPIDLLHLTSLGPSKVTASSSTRFISLWDVHGRLIWKARIRSRCIALASTSTDLVGITENGRSQRWDLCSGKLLAEQSFPCMAPDPDYDNHSPYRGASTASRAPGFVSLSPDLEVLALGYRTGPPCLWDFQDHEFLGCAVDEDNGVVNHMLFNPNPEISMLLVGYSGSKLALFDAWCGALIHCREQDQDTTYASIACSPDGRTAATVDVLGTLRLWDFESLIPLYEVRTPALPFRILDFTSDGASLVDVTDSDMRIWSPSALVRKNVEDDVSTSDVDPSTMGLVQGQYEGVRGVKILCACAHPSQPLVFVGTATGDVVAYSSKTGQAMGVLYAHDIFVKTVSASNTNLLASADANCVVQVSDLGMAAHHLEQSITLQAESLVFNLRLASSVRQLLFSPSGSFLLVSTAVTDYVYSTRNPAARRCVGVLAVEQNSRHLWRWCATVAEDRIGNDGGQEEFVLVADHIVRRYSAARFPATTSVDDVCLRYDIPDGCAETAIESVLIHPATHTLILESRQQAGYTTFSETLLFTLPLPHDFSVGVSNVQGGPVVLRPFAPRFTANCDHLIGLTGDQLAFLHKDSWVSSLELGRDHPVGELAGSDDHSQYARHFFVPNEFTTRTEEVAPLRTAEDDIVLCLHGDLAVVRGGFKFLEPRRFI